MTTKANTKTALTRMLLIQCGATEWDDADRLQGTTDLPMSPSGREAAHAWISAEDFSGVATVLHGPDEASIETATMVAAAAGARTKQSDALSEVALGLWEGLLHSDLEDRYPRAGAQWIADPLNVHPPEGELLAEGGQRVMTELVKAMERCKSKNAVAVVLRPITLGLVRCWLQGVPTTDVWSVLRDGATHEWYEVNKNALKLPLMTSKSA